MSDNLHELGRAAVALPGWEWQPGMLAVEHDGSLWRYVGVDREGDHGWVDGDGLVVWDEPWDVMPMLDDPATLGWLEWLVRRAWGMSCWAETRTGTTWWAYGADASKPDPRCLGYGDSRAHALVAALRAAPGRAP